MSVHTQKRLPEWDLHDVCNKYKEGYAITFETMRILNNEFLAIKFAFTYKSLLCFKSGFKIVYMDPTLPQGKYNVCGILNEDCLVAEFTEDRRVVVLVANNTHGISITPGRSKDFYSEAGNKLFVNEEPTIDSSATERVTGQELDELLGIRDVPREEKLPRVMVTTLHVGDDITSGVCTVLENLAEQLLNAAKTLREK